MQPISIELQNSNFPGQKFPRKTGGGGQYTCYNMSSLGPYQLLNSPSGVCNESAYISPRNQTQQTLRRNNEHGKSRITSNVLKPRSMELAKIRRRRLLGDLCGVTITQRVSVNPRSAVTEKRPASQPCIRTSICTMWSVLRSYGRTAKDKLIHEYTSNDDVVCHNSCFHVSYFSPLPYCTAGDETDQQTYPLRSCQETRLRVADVNRQYGDQER